MEFLLLFLGLMPLAFMTDIFSGSGQGDGDVSDVGTSDEEADALSLDGTSAEGNLLSFLDNSDVVYGGPGVPGGGATPVGDVLQPVEADEAPVPGEPVEPGDILQPVEEDEAPSGGDPVGPDEVLQPVETDEAPVSESAQQASDPDMAKNGKPHTGTWDQNWTGPDGPLTPVEDNEVPSAGDPVDPADVLKPVEADEEPAAGDVVDAGEVLKPVEVDETGTGPNAFPSAQNLPADEAPTGGDDPAAQSEPGAVSWVSFQEESGLSAASVDDFQAGRDTLLIEFAPGLSADGAEVEVSPSEDGRDGMVYVDGILFAVLQDAANATAEDVEIRLTEARVA